MPITLRPLPDSPNIVISDSADFAALTDDEKAANYEHLDVDSNSVFLVHLSNTPLGAWLDLLGVVLDNSHVPPRPSLELEVLESLFLRTFRPSPEVFPKAIGSFFVAPGRLEADLAALVDAGLDLSLPAGATASNAHAILLSRINSVLSAGFELLVLRDIDLLPTVSTTPNDAASCLGWLPDQAGQTPRDWRAGSGTLTHAASSRSQLVASVLRGAIFCRRGKAARLMRPDDALTSGRFLSAPISDIVPLVALAILTAARAAVEAPVAPSAVAIALSAAAPVSGKRSDRASAIDSHFDKKKG